MRRARQIGVGVFAAWAFFLSQGVPLWDDDFTSWFWKIKDQSLWSYVWQWISPVSTQPQFWGFNERPVQAIVYKLGYLVSGYESWSYFLFKDAVVAWLGLLVWMWSRRLAGNHARSEWAAALSAAFVVLSGSLSAAHVLHSDLAPLAELWFLAITYWIWQAVEDTPTRVRGLRDWSVRDLKTWLPLVLLTYLGYKTKADLKLVPAITALYILVIQERRKQWRFFAAPIAALVGLAVPWGTGIFSKLPPFVPGSQGSEIGWMWQPASLGRLSDFLVNNEGWSWWSKWTSPSLALFWNLGPLLILGSLVFLFWIGGGALDRIAWTRQSSRQDRARIFVMLWLAVVILGISALPGINYTFRIRYGLLPWIPVSILLGWVFGLFLDPKSQARLPRSVVALGFGVIVSQLAINLNKAVAMRKDMGGIMIATDRVYQAVGARFPNDPLALLPDFRPFDYRPDGPPAVMNRKWLGKPEELKGIGPGGKPWPKGGTSVISWNANFWEELDFQERFSGCRSSNLFDRIFPCAPGTGAHLYRYIGREPSYDRAEKLRAEGRSAEALGVLQEFITRHPRHFGAHFLIGLAAYSVRDLATALKSYQLLEEYFPNHPGVIYNLALVFRDQGRFDAAIPRLEFVVRQDPSGYGGLYNLVDAYMKAGRRSDARKTWEKMRQAFPGNPEVVQLGRSI